MRATPWIAIVSVAAGVFLVTLIGLPARATYGAQTTADEPQYLLTALSLAHDGDLDIANQRHSGMYRDFHEVSLPVQTVLLPDGARISPHNPLLPVYLAIPMLLGGWVGAKVALALIAATLSGVLLWIGTVRFGVSVWIGALTVCVFLLSPPLAVYATQVYPELAAALAVSVAIAALTGKPDWLSSTLVVVAVGALPWLAVKYIPVAAMLAAFGLWQLRRSPRRLAASGAFLVAAGIAYLWFNQVAYGGWTPYATGGFFVGGELTAMGPSPNFAGRSQRLIGLLFDREFGLIPWQPAYIFAIPAMVWAIRGRVEHRWLLIGLLATGWGVATFVAQTMHGWWWPGRQVVVVLPAAVILVMLALHWVPRLRWWFAGIGAIGVVAFLVISVEAMVGRVTLIVDFTETSNPFYVAMSPLLPQFRLDTMHTSLLVGLWIGALIGLVVLAARWPRTIEKTHQEETHQEKTKIAQ